MITLENHPKGISFIAKVRPMTSLRIEKIKSLSTHDKVKVYMHYYTTQLALKHNYIAVDMSKDNWQKGWSEPTKTFNKIAFFHLWSGLKIKSLEEFYSDRNIEITDCGEDWEVRGYAQRWSINCNGAYEWFWRFEDKFNL